VTRFVFPRERRQRGSRAFALGVATVATIAMGVLPSVGVTSVFTIFNRGVDTTAVFVAEGLRFVATAPRDDTRAMLRSSPSNRRAPVPGSAAPSAVAPQSPAVPPGNAASRGGDRDPYISWTPPAGSYAPRPLATPRFGYFPGTGGFTAAQQDSVLWKLERGVPYAKPVPPSQAERDAKAREDAPRWAFARDEHRPVPMTGSGSGGSIRAPFLSSGPSAAERRRDSAIHAGNLLRLQRLADRARARQDSLRRMDSIALLTRP
jgi:hypothetical protein